MFEPFIWMFKTPDFKRNYIKLVICSIILLLISTVCILWLHNTITVFNNKTIFSVYAYSILLLILKILPFILLLGYFWELTSNIIDRDFDVNAGSIFNGKIQTINKFTFPNWDPFKFVWRGFASIVATSIMAIPWTVLLTMYITGNIAQNYTPASFMANIDTIYKPIVLLALIYTFLLPGLFWNYASKNSVFSALNIHKAVYIAGNYTFRYLINSFLFIAICCLFWDISIIFINPNLIFNPQISFSYIIVQILLIIKNAFLIHIQAYLLGTITPPSEG